jgi:hypothetical protein
MKKILLPFLLFFALSQAHAQSGVCDTAYFNHTYNSSDLKIYDSCVTITATIKLLDPPALTGDRDYHIYTQPDSQFRWMIYLRDTSFVTLCQGSLSGDTFPGWLNVEEICKGPSGGGSNPADAACGTFNSSVYLPNTGEYVEITGPFRYDIVHCWNEIHPVSKMVVIPAGISGPDWASVADGLKVFPQPAGHELEFQFDRAPGAVALIKIYSITGEQLFIYGLAKTSSLKLDISTWPTGEYLYSIVAEEQNKVVKTGKISVVH